MSQDELKGLVTSEASADAGEASSATFERVAPPTEPSSGPAERDANAAPPLVAADRSLQDTLIAGRAPATDAHPAVAEQQALSLRPTEQDVSSPRGALKRVTLIRPGTDVEPTSDPAQGYIGCVIDERYVVEAVLGKGGMGVVYRGRHQVIDKLIAIKILLPNFASDPEVTERFVTEARAASSIGNAHIVDITDFGSLPDGSTYFVMEYLEGKPLGRVIREQAPLSEARIVRIGQQIARALAAAHAVQIVHRDLKPDNVYILDGEHGPDYVKVLDFGIAKVTRGQNKITRAGTIFGTPHYMSPEQASGSDVNAQSDVYSLGVLLYEMATGEVPFDSDNPMGLLTQHMFTAPPPPSRFNPEMSAGLEAVVLKCLAKEAQDRFPNMAALALELEFLAKGVEPQCFEELRQNPDRFKIDPLWARQRFGRRRGKGRLVGVAVVALLLGAGAVVLTRPDTLPGATEALASAASATTPSSVGSAPATARVGVPVAIVVSPIDAHVFRDGRDLGAMPVTVHIYPPEKVTVEVRRDGFHSKTLTLLGKRRRIAIELVAIPGVKPAVPVPDSGKLLDLTPDNVGGDAGAGAGWVELDEPEFQDLDPMPSASASATKPPASKPSASAAPPGPAPSAADEPYPE